MRARAVLAGLAACAATAFAAEPAQAAMSFEPCTPAGFECDSLAVPLVRGAAAPGSLVLRATRRRVGAVPSASAVVPLAGGPGQAALPLAADFTEVLAPALAQRDLLVFDERGTGRSGRLSCPALENGGTSVAAVRRCAVELGPTRVAYRTADTVADLENLRREAGYERLVLVGVSYGTKVALDYAAAHPDRVEALVLDSVVPPDGWDPLLRPTLVAVPRVLLALCARGACRGITGDPVRDLRALVRRVARRPVRGTLLDARGRRLGITIDPLGVFNVLLAGDENPTLRSDLPAAVRGALRGDLRPLLRLRLRASGLVGQPSHARLQVPLEGDTSDALYAATLCGESRLPWGAARTLTGRLSRAEAAARRLPAAALSIFPAGVALAAGPVRSCLGWPDVPAPTLPVGPLPAVPALLLDGEDDLRTPLENAQAIGAQIPGARVVGVPFTGHSVLGADLGDCARGQLEAFFTGTPPAACDGTRPIPPAPVAPTRLALVAGATRAARTLTAVRGTVADVSRQFLGDAIAAGQSPPPGSRVPGLRGGVATWSAAGIRLRAVQYVPGVAVSGLLRRGAAASTLRVGGRAAAGGVVRLGADGRLRGRLGGSAVEGAIGSAAAAARARLG